MKYLVVIVAILYLSFAATFTVSAHPGRTDSNGGHTCRTNCESWGLSYGEYHYHNGDYVDEPDYFDQGSEAGGEHVSKNSDYITSQATNSGSALGREHGLAGDIEDSSTNGEDVCSSVDFADQSSPEEYYDGFMDSYKDGCTDKYANAYSKAYTEAYASAFNERLVSADAADDVDESSSSSNSDLSNLLWVAGIIGAVVTIGNWDSIRSWYEKL